MTDGDDRTECPGTGIEKRCKQNACEYDEKTGRCFPYEESAEDDTQHNKRRGEGEAPTGLYAGTLGALIILGNSIRVYGH
jgi:hypothetical protein